MISNKVSRRDAIKVLSAAAAALAATPLIVAASAREQTMQAVSVGKTSPSVGSASKEPLMIFVKDGEVLGYRGEEEVTIRDGSLSGQLHLAFESNRRVE